MSRARWLAALLAGAGGAAAWWLWPAGAARAALDCLPSAVRLDEAGVACLPGTSFGALGEGYLRFSYANSVENIEKALKAMKAFLPSLAPPAVFDMRASIHATPPAKGLEVSSS